MLTNCYLISFKTLIINILAILSLFTGCANQQPPGGGEEDKIPPKVKIISPKPNTVNFKGSVIEFEFNEYVDRRSFQDAFRISPAIKGEIEYDWGSTSVEVKFPGELSRLQPDKTFVINISTALTDIHGAAISEPVNFAFSTGSKIDVGSISGTVYNNDSTTAAIFAYRIEDETKYDPTKNIPDYLTETSKEGSFILTNLAGGKYRVIAVVDDDRNLFYTPELESYGVLPYEIVLPDSGNVGNVNFYLKKAVSREPVPPELDYTKYFKDSTGIIYTSIENDSRIVAPDQSIYFFFSQHKPTRDELVNHLKITGENNQDEKLVFNWRNDSLVEVFAANRFKPNFKYSIGFIFNITKDSVYSFRWKFKTVGKNSFGELKGSVRTNYESISLSDYNVRLNMDAAEMLPPVKYSFDISDTVYSLTNILEAEYVIFSFIDINGDNSFNYGNPYPFIASEPFYIYPSPLRIRGGWTVENVVISFVK